MDGERVIMDLLFRLIDKINQHGWKKIEALELAISDFLLLQDKQVQKDDEFIKFLAECATSITMTLGLENNDDALVYEVEVLQ